jgi:hypothetical protein
MIELYGTLECSALAATGLPRGIYLTPRKTNRKDLLLLANRNHNLSTELVLPCVQEAQSPRSRQSSITGQICQLASKSRGARCSGWIAGTMARKHVQIRDVRSRWQWELIHTKARRVRKVMTQLPVQLEDVGVVSVASNWDLCFQRSVWDV